MKTNLLRALLAAAVLCGASTAQAQWSAYRPESSLWLVGWGIAQPIGDMKDFQSGTSVNGFAMEFRSIVRPRLSAGLAFDYNRFSRTRSMETSTRPDGSVLSAPTYRYADNFGVKATGHYYLTDGGLRPYVGAGIGGNWNYAYLQIADVPTDHASSSSSRQAGSSELAAGRSKSPSTWRSAASPPPTS
jgi:opacity protein-like surface antigen